MTPTPDVQAVLERAAELIERDGWSQTSFGIPVGPKCILGAVRAAAPSSLDPYDEACAELRRRIGADKATGWNDAPGRTVDEVLAVLRGAR